MGNVWLSNVNHTTTQNSVWGQLMGKMNTSFQTIEILILLEIVMASSLISNFTFYKYIPIKIDFSSWTTDKEYKQVGVGEHG